jgi:hypothetical protein
LYLFKGNDMSGRKKLSELNRLKSKVSRMHWKHQDVLTEEFADEHMDKEIQFNESEKRMGRPPKKIHAIRRESYAAYLVALEDYRDQEILEGVDPVSDREIFDYKKSDRAGRKAKDEILHIKKYIRRTQRQIDDIKSQDDSDFAIDRSGPGRKGMTKHEKIQSYQERIREAEENIKKLLVGKAAHEVIYYELFELKNDRRTIVVEQKKHSEDSQEFIGFEKDIGLLDELIEPVQIKYNEALQLAGLKHVRAVPSARARPTTEVNPGGWVVDSKKLASRAGELSEVDKLKQEMLEVKQMIIEQAELIKALTNKC